MTMERIRNLIEAVKAEDYARRDAAAKALVEIGPPAVPALIQLLKYRDSLLRRCCAALVRAISFGRLSFQSTEDSVRWAAARVLARLGASAVAALTKALKDKDADVRRHAAEVLGEIGTKARAAVGALVESLNDVSNTVRFYASYALGEVGTGAKIAAPKLEETLMDEDSGVRVNAALALWQCAKNQKGVPVLLQELKQSKSHRCEAAQALGEIGDVRAVMPLVEALQDQSSLVWDAAVLALAKVGRSNPDRTNDILRVLLKTLDTKDPFRRAAAVAALGELRDPLAIRALSAALSDKDRDLRKAAVEALAKFGGDRDPEAIGALSAAINDRDRYVREAAVEALTKFGGELPVEALGLAVKDEDFFVRAAAMRALKQRMSLPRAAAVLAGLQTASERRVVTPVVKCSRCSKPLKWLGEDTFAPGARVVGSPAALAGMEQWYGNVCLTCRVVFCATCIAVGDPTPCPKCGQPTAPAMRKYLEQAGLLQ